MENQSNPQNLGDIIREYCPELTATLTSDTQDNCGLETDHLEPRVLGADNTRRLFTHAYGMYCNGYTYEIIASNITSLFRIEVDTLDVNHIIGSIEFESTIASRTLLP